MNIIEQLKSKRDAIAKQFATIGEFRPGSLSLNKRRCGKPSCHCANEDDAGHPAWLLSRKLKGRSDNRHIPKYALDATQKQVEQYNRFMDLVRQFAEINDEICELSMNSLRGKKKRNATQNPQANIRR